MNLIFKPYRSPPDLGIFQTAFLIFMNRGRDDENTQYVLYVCTAIKRISELAAFFDKSGRPRFNNHPDYTHIYR